MSNKMKTEVYRSGVSSLLAGDGLVREFNPAGIDLPVEIYWCAHCGHFATFIAEDDKAHLGNLVQSAAWKNVG